MTEIWLVAAGFAAGLVNAIAGGGPLLTLAALTAAGLDPRIANLTSTVALCPGQLLAGWRGRASLGEMTQSGLRPRPLLVTTTAGGAVGGLLLLWTSTAGFAAIVPWLVLLSTALYASGSRGSGRPTARRWSIILLAAALLLSAVYGGYFGGGNSFIVLALLGLAGIGGQAGAGAKNVLIASINLGAVLVFVASGEIAWGSAVAVGVGGVLGSLAGAQLLPSIRAAVLRPLIILCGLTLAGWYLWS